MAANNKFLVNWIETFSNKQLFFLIWLAIVASFVALMIGYYRRNTRRNFKGAVRSPRAVTKGSNEKRN